MTKESVVKLKCREAKNAPQPASNDVGLGKAFYSTKVLFAGIIPVSATLWTGRVSWRTDKVVDMVGSGTAMCNTGRAESCCAIIFSTNGGLLVCSQLIPPM